METLSRPMDRREQRIFLLCVIVSAALHLLLAWLALPDGSSSEEAARDAERLGERFAQAVNAVTEPEPREKARVKQFLDQVQQGGWRRTEMADTLQWLASDLGIPVRDSDVVRALDPERSREGRFDIRVWINWDETRDAVDLLLLAILVGEGTLKSDFGSHRFWIHLEAPDGSGRVAFETMDCRLYRVEKLRAADLLHRSTWTEP